MTNAQTATDAQVEEPLFRCGECDEPVIVFDKRFFRTCEHYNGVIIATAKAAEVITNDN